MVRREVLILTRCRAGGCKCGDDCFTAACRQPQGLKVDVYEMGVITLIRGRYKDEMEGS